MKRHFALASILFLACRAIHVQAQGKPTAPPPPAMRAPASDAKGAEEILASFLGIAFREDGTMDEHGKYTLFSRPGKYFNEPGLNCSGFILAAARLLFQKNIQLSVAMRDRLGDSGPGAALGQDWDFGWDLILNITDGLKRSLLLPGGGVVDPAAGSGLSPLGLDLHSPETWQELPSRIRQNHIYFVSFSRPTYRSGYKLLHSHVGILIRTSAIDWHLYHSINKSGVVRENFGNAQTRARFLEANPNFGNARRHMFIVEVPMAKS